MDATQLLRDEIDTNSQADLLVVTMKKSLSENRLLSGWSHDLETALIEVMIDAVKKIAQAAKPTLHIVSVSSGVPSALTAILAIGKYGKENVELVFADTLVEHEDNYRFLRDLEAYTCKEITRLSDGRTPFQVGEDEHYLPTQAFATCTQRLKIELIMKHVEMRQETKKVHMHIGYDLSDKRRVAKTQSSWKSRGVETHFPIIDLEIIDPKQAMFGKGFELPYTYSLGFKHANCLGEMGGCVKFGKGDMLKVLNHFPNAYKNKEKWELGAIQRHVTRNILNYVVMGLILDVSPFELGFKVYTFLRDFENKYDGMLTLKRFREDYESAQQTPKQLEIFIFDAEVMAECSKECGVSGIFEDAE